MDNILKLLGKVFAYTVLEITAVAVLVRGVVGPLWGSASDFGLIGAVLAGVVGVLGLLWLASLFVKDVLKSISTLNS